MSTIAEPEAPGTAVAPLTKAALRVLRPVAAPAEMIKSQNEARAFIEQVLEKDRDYGVIPGVKKPTLLKPGAEKVTLGFGCSAVPRILEQEIDHDRAVHWVKQQKKWNNAFRGDKSFMWEKQEGDSIGLYRYVVQVEIVDEHGQVRGSGIGSCSSMESKYVDRPRDSENTILKMATKRAHVAGVLSTFGLSEQFTQDVEETAAPAAAAAEPPAAELSPLDKTWPNWPHFPYAGKKFREIPNSVLTKQLMKAQRTTDAARDKGDMRVAEMGDRLIETIEFVLEDRRAHPEHTPAEPAPDAPVAEPAKTETPAPAAAVAVAPAEAGQVDDEDDDLPF